MGMLWTVFLFWVWTYVTQSNSSSQEDSGNDGLILLRFINCIMSLEKENEMLVPMVCSHVNKYIKAMVDSESKDEGHIPELQLDPDVNFMMDAQPSGISMHLHETVKLMMAAGFEQECCDAYSNCHKEFLEQCLWALGLQLQALNTWNIENWIKTCKAAGKILFPNERRLCDSVFFGLSRAVDVSFTKVCKGLTIRLLSFADTMITTESYFLLNLLSSVIPKMSESLHEIKQELLLHKFCKDSMYMLLKADVKKVEKRLNILKAFAKIIYGNTAQATVAGGGLHLITLQLVNYIHLIRLQGTVQEYSNFPDRGKVFIFCADSLDDRVAREHFGSQVQRRLH